MSEEMEVADSGDDYISQAFSEIEVVQAEESASDAGEDTAGETTEDIKQTDGAEDSKATEESTSEPSESQIAQENFEKRIARQTAANRAAQERADKLQSELEALKTKYEPKVTEMPKEDDFGNYDDFLAARDKHIAETASAETEQRIMAAQAQTEINRQSAEMRATFEASEAKFRASTPDYDVVANVVNDRLAGEKTPALETVVQGILESDTKAELVYELGKNPQTLDKMASLTPMQAARELFRLEMGISTKSEQSQPKPKPMTPVGSGGEATKKLFDLSPDELMKKVTG